MYPDQQSVPQYPFQQPPQGQNSQNGSPKKKLVIIVSAAVAVLFIILVVALIFGQSNGTEEPVAEAPTALSEVTRPATSASIEEINNAINQDLSTIDDAADFPEDQLSDDNIEL